MALMAADALVVEDGPECPGCGSTRWRATMELVEAEDTAELLSLVLQLARLECLGCGAEVEMGEDPDVPDGMRWRPNPHGGRGEGLPSVP